jgi:putative ABC transport system permease protein
MFSVLYNWMLRACPADVRDECGADLEAIARYCIDVEAARRGPLGRQWAVARGLADMLLFTIRARRDARARRKWSVSPQTSVTPGRSPMLKLFATKDLKAAFRQMRARPLFAAAVVFMLALGIGATTAIFSVVYGVLLKPLPFPEADRIVEIWGSMPARAINQTSLAEANTWDLHDMNQTLVESGSSHAAAFSLTGGDVPERVTGAQVSAGFLRTLGVTPLAGRLFAPGEDAPGAVAERVIISERLWKRRFGGAASIVGQNITLGGRPYEVIGVVPDGPVFFSRNDVFVPFIRRNDADRDSWEYAMIGRLKPGVSFETAAADLKRVGQQLASHKENAGWEVVINRSDVWIASPELRRMLWIMLGAVLLLLVIACVNVANLLLVRASSRIRERAVRTALGATRADLIRESVSESMLFTLIGMGAGWAVAIGMLKAFKAADPGGIPRLADVELNGWVLLFTAAVAAVVGLVTGLVPALSTPFSNIVTAIRSGQRGSIGDRAQDRTRATFVAIEVALSVLLLIGAGLLVRSLTNVLNVDRGFATERRLTAVVSLPAAYPPGRRAEIATAILQNVEALPDVLKVSAVSGIPLAGGSTGMGFAAAERSTDANAPWASWRIVTKDYFSTMGLKLLAGRGFTTQDEIGRPWRVIISDRLAKQMWPGENPIGRTAILWKGQGESRGEVIGVVSDMRERGLENDPTLAVYFPAYGNLGGTTLRLVLETRGKPEDVTGSLRAVVKNVDPSLPVSGVRSLEDIVSASVATRRFTMSLIATFAGVALVLALAGVAGVLAYAMARRTGEMGIRLALGARHAGLVALAMRQGLTPVVIGIVIGLGATFWMAKLMTNLLFGVTPADPMTYAAACTALLLSAAIACYLPARKALKVDPASALRTE